MAARQTALGALIACRKQGAWSDGVLKEYVRRDQLDRREAALAARLCYGVLQNRMRLDFYLEQLVKGRLRDLQPVVLDILRLGLYQILWLEKVPDSAAVNEAVEQGKKYANPKAAALINGVLRNAVRRRMTWREPQDLATRYSHPQALVRLLAGEMGPEDLEAVLAADNQAPETVLQANPLAGDPAELPAEIQAAGGSCTAHPWLERCFLVSGVGSLERLEVFRQGLCYVQDAASRLAVRCAGVKPGMAVFRQLRRARGKKALPPPSIWATRGGFIPATYTGISWPFWKKGAARLGLSCINTRLQDAREPVSEWIGAMDRVLVDVPCSGLGIIRKKPDIRYKDLTQTQALPRLQLEILCNQARYVKPGGALLYSPVPFWTGRTGRSSGPFWRSIPTFSRCFGAARGHPGAGAGDAYPAAGKISHRRIFHLSAGEAAMREDIKSMTLPELQAAMKEMGQPAFRAGQIYSWLHRGAVHFADMTNLSKDLRQRLEERYRITAPEVVRRQESSQDGTIKYLWRLEDGNCVETVLMRYRYGNSVCISSEVGCAMGCAFCASTLGGLVRRLRPSEMLDQVLFTQLDSGLPVSHIVLMGIGEPLDNLTGARFWSW